MIPLRDNIRSDTTPVVNFLLIAICGLAFLIQMADQSDGQDLLVESLGMIPEQFFQETFSITAHESGGVAWWAHVGGFAAGFAVAWFLDRTHRLKQTLELVIPHTQRPNRICFGN